MTSFDDHYIIMYNILCIFLQSVLLFKKLDVLKLKCYNNIKAPIIINDPV